LEIPPFSIVMPVRSEAHLLRRSLPSCYAVDPDEVILCLDDPPHEETLSEAKRISARLGYASKTRILPVARNDQYRFHQAWVRRRGFREAKHDRILTVDVDLVIRRNVLKAVSLVGKDDIGLVSCMTLHSVRGPIALWRAIGHRLANLFIPPAFTGLYALWRPFWLNTENEGIKDLADPRAVSVKGDPGLVGEDAYLFNCMRLRHRCVHLPDVGGRSLRDDFNDGPEVQFEIGRYYATKSDSLGLVLIRSLGLARFHYLRGYVYHMTHKMANSSQTPKTKNHSEPIPQGKTREFWSRAVPMTFDDQPKTYDEKRRFRYELQDYMHEVFRFDSFADKRVLEMGSGAGIDSAEFLRNGAKVVSMDFSLMSTRSTKSLFREAGLDGDVVMADARFLPFRDEKFDVAYSFGVIHHIPAVSAVLDEVKRTLRHDGLFMGMVYNKDSLLYAYSIIYLHGIREELLAQGTSELEIASRFSERFTGNAYTKAYTRDEITKLLRAHFRSVSLEPKYNVIDTVGKRKVKFQLEKLQNELGWHLIFKASK